MITHVIEILSALAFTAAAGAHWWLRLRPKRQHSDVLRSIDALEEAMGLNPLTEDEMLQRIKYTQRGYLTDDLRATMQQAHREQHDL